MSSQPCSAADVMRALTRPSEKVDRSMCLQVEVFCYAMSLPVGSRWHACIEGEPEHSTLSSHPEQGTAYTFELPCCQALHSTSQGEISG